MRSSLPRRVVAASLAALTFVAVSSTARADDFPLDHVTPKVDGRLGEWTSLTKLYAPTTGTGMNVSAAIGADDAGIYVAIDVDKKGGIVQGRDGAADVDCARLVVGIPQVGVSRGPAPLTTFELAIYPGTPGKLAGVVQRVGVGDVDGAQIVEWPKKEGGYTMEALIPWKTFGTSRRVKVGLRAGLRVTVAQAGQTAKVFYSGPADASTPSKLDFLQSDVEQSLAETLKGRKISARMPSFEIVADVIGDAGVERALVFGQSIFLEGSAFRDGKQWAEIPVGADVVAIDAKDVTGDGHADLLVTTRVKSGGTTREALHVFAIGGPKGSESATHIFSHETRVASASGELRDDVSFASVDGKPGVKITYAAATGGASASTWREPQATDVDAILLPWGPVKARRFTLKSGRFEIGTEDAQTPTLAREAATTTATATATATATTPTTMTKPTHPPDLASAGEVVTVAVEKYKREHGVDARKLGRLRTDVQFGKEGAGKAMIFGKDLVVATGGSIAGYSKITMGKFASEDDVISITAIDLTGDGRDDLVVRGKSRAKFTSKSGDQEVVREMLLVYVSKIDSGLALSGALQIEVGRAMGDASVTTSVELVGPTGKSPARIDVKRGTATRWTRESWPFGSEPASAVEPLLLPWSSDETRSYTWTGDKFKSS